MAKRKGQPARPRPYLKTDGTPDRRFSVSRYLRNDGRKRGNIKFPSGVRSIPALYRTLHPVAPKARPAARKVVRRPEPPVKRKPSKPAPAATRGRKQKEVSRRPIRGEAAARKRAKESPQPHIPKAGDKEHLRRIKEPKAPWLKTDGTVDKRLAIAKYLKKDGTLKKGRKLPAGVKSVSELWDYLNAEKLKPEPDMDGMVCVRAVALPWNFHTFIETEFHRFKEVYMGGKKLKDYDDMLLYLDDYLNEMVLQENDDEEMPSTGLAYGEILYTICRNNLYEYLYF